MTKYKFYVDGNNNVIAVSRYGGKVIKSVAKCSPEDTYDIEIGKALAAARCDVRVAKAKLRNAERKLDEASLACDRAARRYDDMCEYYDDATEQFWEAKNNLDTLLDNIK